MHSLSPFPLHTEPPSPADDLPDIPPALALEDAPDLYRDVLPDSSRERLCKRDASKLLGLAVVASAERAGIPCVISRFYAQAFGEERWTSVRAQMNLAVIAGLLTCQPRPELKVRGRGASVAPLAWELTDKGRKLAARLWPERSRG